MRGGKGAFAISQRLPPSAEKNEKNQPLGHEKKKKKLCFTGRRTFQVELVGCDIFLKIFFFFLVAKMTPLKNIIPPKSDIFWRKILEKDFQLFSNFSQIFFDQKQLVLHSFSKLKEKKKSTKIENLLVAPMKQGFHFINYRQIFGFFCQLRTAFCTLDNPLKIFWCCHYGWQTSIFHQASFCATRLLNIVTVTQVWTKCRSREQHIWEMTRKIEVIIILMSVGYEDKVKRKKPCYWGIKHFVHPWYPLVTHHVHVLLRMTLDSQTRVTETSPIHKSCTEFWIWNF